MSTSSATPRVSKDQVTGQAAVSVDGATFRSVMGHYPTGVVLVTGIDENGGPQGMVVGTFASVSLEPVLVSFMPAVTSSSWARMKNIKNLCINVLAADQEDLCRRFASRAIENKWENVSWRPGPDGAPIVDGSLAWIACTVVEVMQRGDHLIVLSEVQQMEAVRSVAPLTFIRGGYGRFTTESIVSVDMPGLMDQLRVSQTARSAMERLARDTGYEVTAQAVSDDELVILAAAGGGESDSSGGQHIGIRVPFIPPFGALFMAWAAPDRVEHWLNSRWVVADDFKERMLTELRDIREAGFTVVTPVVAEIDEAVDRMFTGETVNLERIKELRGRVHELDPFLVTDVQADERHRVRYIGAPVFDQRGRVILSMHLRVGEELDGKKINELVQKLRQTADGVSAKIEGQVPGPEALEQKA